MTGNDFENLFRFLRVKLRPAGAQQDSFTPETESEHLAQQGVGMEDHLRITGLMAMPPLQHDPEQNRVYFRRLSDLAVWLNAQQDACTFDQLSMGTSSDFEVAIEEGATIIRLGESIFGPRIYEEKI